MKVSLMGLGVMGFPMAKNLHEAGYLYKVYNRTRKAYFFDEFHSLEDTPMDAARGADIIIIMVADSQDVEEVVLGESGVIRSAKRGTVVIDMSSTNPEVTKRIGLILSEHGIEMVDAPVSGGEQGAISGELAIMAGGNENIIQKCTSIFKVLGNVVHVGPLGTGGYTKLANQIIVALNIQAISEAIYLAKNAQIDIDKLYNAITNGLAGSKVLDQKINNLKEEEFKPGAKINLHLKDINNALLAADSLQLELPFTNKLKQVMEEMVNNEMSGLDHSSLYKYLKNINEREINRDLFF